WRRLDAESWTAKAEAFAAQVTDLIAAKPFRKQSEAKALPLKFYAYPLATVTPRDLLLLDRLPGDSNKSALEIGTGSATSMFRLGPHFRSLHGADISPEIIDWTAEQISKTEGLKD